METTPTPPSPVRLVDLAAELGTTPEDLGIPARDTFTDSIGFKVCTAFKASQVLKAHRERQAREQALAARNNERTRAAVDRLHADISGGVERDGDPGSKVQALNLEFLTLDVSPIPAAASMLAKEPPPEYDGAVSTPRPSRLDWLTGRGEGAGTIGPTREQIQRDAKRRVRGGGQP